MRLRKTMILLLILLLLLPLTACRREADIPDNEDPDLSENPEDPGDNPDEPEPDPDVEPDPEPPEKTILAGIALGDPATEVIRLFGRLYEEDFFFADEGYYGEDVAFWNYQERIFFTIGQATQKVLRIDVTVGDYETNLGSRVGQRAMDVLPKYRGLYPQLVSIHTDGEVPGWFLVENGGLLIFNFNDGEEPLFGVPIPDNAILAGITLAYHEHFD
jgi:hypothetical protein